ncbi:MAG: response regulator [Chitinophagaceae bacterium]|nr:response regulator [Chitinophagaceae bacterium]
MRKLIWAIIASFVCIPSLWAHHSPAVSYLGIEQGLSNNEVTCLYQDHNGYMWVGTYDGLNRYDGYQFKIFRKQPDDSTSLIFNRISSLEEDAGSNLWIGTQEGVCVFNPVTSRFSPLYYQPFGKTLPKKLLAEVSQVRCDRRGNVFIATTTAGLIVYKKDGKTAVQIPYGARTDYEVTSIEFDNGQDTWLFIRNEGLCRYDHRTNSIRLVYDGIRNGNCLKADDRGNIFIGADNGVFQFGPVFNTILPVLSTTSKIVRLTILANRDMWIASDGGGIYILHAATGKITPFPEADQGALIAVYDICQDKEDRIWIGTLRGGINIIDPKRARFKTVRHDPLNGNSLINDFVLSFSEDADQNIWIGTDGGGLSYWDKRKNKFINYRHDPANPRSISNNFITGLLIDRAGEVWIAAWNGGVNRLNRQTGAFERFSCINPVTNKEEKNVWKLYEDKQGRLWASTLLHGSLYCFNRQKNMFELFDQQLNTLLTIAEDRNDQLWCGDQNTLIRIDKTQKRHKRYWVGNRVRAIHEDKTGRFWIGTEDGGLLLFNRNNGAFTRYTEKDGLCSNAVLNILEDARGNLWISTFNGLSKFDPVTRRFTNYSQSDGLQSNQFNYNAALTLHSGEMIFGGIKGFNIFCPEEIYTSRVAPPIYISGIRVNNVPVETDISYIARHSSDQIQEIKLPFSKATLSLDFVALEYTSPDKINYAYSLEGRDEGWIFAGKNRTVNYTRLQEGRYVFKVKAMDADGVWSGKEQQLSIVVLPPWYRSWWAYLLYFAAAASLVYTYLRYQAQKTRLAYEVAWAKKETERVRELNEKKLSFFTNISHEFRAPLTLIINPLKELLYHPEKTSGTNDLGIVYRNARRLLSLVDQLLLFRKADTEADKLKITRLNFSALCREVFICFSQQAKTKNIQYEFACDNPDIELFVDREKMEIVLFNLVSNALKFTPEGGAISFEIKEDMGTVNVHVRDSGCGIEGHVGDKLFERFYQEKNRYTPSKSGFGIGLYLVKQFVDAHKGGISYQSEINKGTQFTLVLQKGAGHFHGQYIHEEIAERPLFLHELMSEATQPEAPEAEVTPDAGWQEIITDKKTVLLVDDNPEIRSYLSQIFKEQFIIYEAEDGETGWRLALNHIPDVIISDVLMNGLTGVELCRKIREEPSLMHVPVILLTASSSSEIKLKGIECGADDYITKPFEKDLLIARVDNILKGRNTLQQYFFDRITLKKNYSKIPLVYKEFLEKCIAIVEKNLDNDGFTIKMLVKEMNMSHSSLYKKVKATSGQSVNAFIRLIRLRRAAVLLLSTDANISEVAFQVGISDIKYFRKQFVKLFGMPPSEYIKKYKGSFSKEFNVTFSDNQ